MPGLVREKGALGVAPRLAWFDRSRLFTALWACKLSTLTLALIR